MTFPSYTTAKNYKGGFDKFVYDKLKELSLCEFVPSTYDVEVSVTDGTNPISGVAVKLTLGTKEYTGTTGSKGGCSINKILSNTTAYNVTATKSGYTYAGSTLTVDGNKNLEIVMIQDTA